MAIKLTDRLVLNLQYDHEAAKVNDITWDLLAVGLGIKVTPAGKKTWLVQAIWPGQSSQSRRVLGPYPGLSLEEARVRCREWLDVVRQGQDPLAVERATATRAAVQRDNTFGKATAAYLANCRQLGQRHVDQDEKEIARHLLSEWASTSLASITKADVGRRLRAIASTSPAVAYACFGHVRRIFNFAIDGDEDYGITSSPCDRLKPKALGLRKRLRQHLMSDDEIAALWRATEQLTYPERHFYRWLLLTGCRRGDAAEAPWREFNMTRKVWVIPAERFKSEAPHVLPLTDAMLAVLDSMPKGGEWLFSHDGVKHLNGFAKLKNKVDALMGDVSPWQNHDLRRVVRTKLSELKVKDEVAELVLGHAKRGLKRIYDQYGYLPEKRAALEAWHTRLAELVG